MDNKIRETLKKLTTYIEEESISIQLSKSEIDIEKLELLSTSRNVHIMLSGVIAFSIISLPLLLIWESPVGYLSTLRSILIAITCGAMGSGISALRSSLQRTANGWEFSSGLKLPYDDPKDKFSIKMSSFFYFRPILGVVASIIVFAMIESEIVEIVNRTEYHLIFWCILAGLFAKTLFDKLNDLFKAFIPGK